MVNLGFLSAAHIHAKGFLENIAALDTCQVVSLWDDVVDRGQRYADEYNTEYEGDLAKITSRQDIDGFIICSENTRHLPLLEAAIATGKPIFCEKPFTTKVDEAQQALELIRQHKAKVHMGYFQPFDGIMQGVIKTLAEGRLGTITQMRFRNAHHAAYGHWFDSDDLSWFYDPSLSGGGAFMDMGAHAAHLVRTIFGPVESVVARIDNVSGIYSEVDDSGTAMLRFASGVLGTIEASWVQTGGIGGLEVTGSEGTLYNDPQQGYIITAPGKEAVAVETGVAKPTRVDRLVAVIDGSFNDEELASDLQCAADAVGIIEAAYRSSEENSWVDVTIV